MNINLHRETIFLFAVLGKLLDIKILGKLLDLKIEPDIDSLDTKNV